MRYTHLTRRGVKQEAGVSADRVHGFERFNLQNCQRWTCRRACDPSHADARVLRWRAGCAGIQALAPMGLSPQTGGPGPVFGGPCPSGSLGRHSRGRRRSRVCPQPHRSHAECDPSSLDDLVLVPLGIWVAIRLMPPLLFEEHRHAAMARSPPRLRSGGWAALILGLWGVAGGAMVWWFMP